MGGNDSCNCALAKAMEANWWALEATHILEEKIEWLSWSATGIGSTGCWHSHSHGHLRRWSRGCPRGHAKTPAGEHHTRAPSHQESQRGRCFPSPNPTQLRRQVTFQDQQGESSSEEYSSGEHMGQASSQRQTSRMCNLGAPTYPGVLSWSLSWGANTHAGYAEGGHELPPEPSMENYKVWVEW